jgi:hypothetical protein
VSADREGVVVTHQPVHSIINQRAIGGQKSACGSGANG